MLQDQTKTTRTGVARLLHYLRSGGSLLTVAALVVVGFWGGHWLSPTQMHEEEAEESAAGVPLAREVTLTPQKIAAAGIATEKIAVRDIQQVDTVPGKLGYNELRHVEIKTPVASVVEKLMVRPGQAVKKGEPLAVLSSSEVAVARNELLQAVAEVRLAQTRYSWQQEIHKNLLDLMNALERGESMESIESEFAKRTLGEQRQVLLSAYSELRLAEQVLQQSRKLKEDGALSGRIFQERLSQRERAAVKFRAVLDQVQYDVQQQVAIVEAELQVSRRRQAAKEEKLKLLMGPFSQSQPEDGGQLSHYRIHAPFAGKIADLRCSATLRVAQGEQLMVVADDSQLWLSARIHQRQWAAVQLEEEQTVTFRLPAYPERRWNAQVSFIGTEVVADSHYLPLVAVVDNSDGQLRPGMFAWVDVPLSVGQRKLAIPATALQRHEGKTFVFVRTGPQAFQRRDVQIGTEAGTWIAIEEGLAEGDEVVSHGAFYLKSELLLEGEAE